MEIKPTSTLNSNVCSGIMKLDHEKKKMVRKRNIRQQSISVKQKKLI